MSIHLGRSGQNLTIRVVPASVNEKVDRDKLINKLIVKKIPIYKADTFLYFEIPISSLPLVYKLWKNEEITVDGKVKEWVDNFKFNSVAIDELPKEILTFDSKDGRTLKEYQKAYISTTFDKKNMVSLIDCGGGKTCCSLLRAKNQGFEKLLVITLKQIFSDWSSEIRNVLADDFLIFTGDKKKREKLKEEFNSVPIVVTNYEMLKEISDLTVFDHIIVDEAHLIGNPSTKAYKELKKLIKNCKQPNLQLLTGSPLESRLENLYTLLHLASPVNIGSKDDFLKRFQQEVAWKTITTKYGPKRIPIKFKTKNVEDLRDVMKPIVYRINLSGFNTFEDLTELVTCSMTRRQRTIYEETRDEILLEIDSKTLQLSNALTRMLRLLQAAEGIFNFEEGSQESGKLDLIKHEIDSTDEKLIIWSRFKPITNLIQDIYPDKTVVINGDQSDSLKQLAKWSFQGCKDSDELKQFNELLKKNKDFRFGPGEAQILTSTVGLKSGVGANYDKCAYQIFPSFDWSSRAVLQAMSRIRRMTSQHEFIKTKFLVSEDTIEGQVLTKILQKMKNAANILDGKEAAETIQAADVLRMLRG